MIIVYSSYGLQLYKLFTGGLEEPPLHYRIRQILKTVLALALAFAVFFTMVENIIESLDYCYWIC